MWALKHDPYIFRRMGAHGGACMKRANLCRCFTAKAPTLETFLADENSLYHAELKTEESLDKDEYMASKRH